MGVFTAEEIINRAAADADMHDNFVTQEQWLSWFAVETRALDHFLTRSGLPSQNPQSQFNSTSAGSIQLGGGGLFTDVIAILGVWEERNGRYRRLKYERRPDFARVQSTSGDSFAGEPRGDATTWAYNRAYGLTDLLTISLSPKPTDDKLGKYFCIYETTQLQPHPDTSLTLATTVGYPLGLEEILVLKLARRALMKEESDTSTVDRRLAQEMDRADEYAKSIVIGGTHAVRNVDRWERDWANWEDPWSVYLRDSWVWV